MEINLNFINNSNDSNNSEVVIFQQNTANSFDQPSTAWKVIRNSGQSDNHTFTFSTDYEVTVSDSFGNFTPKLNASNGQKFHMIKNSSGNVLEPDGNTTRSRELEIANNLTMGAINANIYRNGRLLATKTNLAPGEKAVFEFQPIIWVGVASEVVEGELINSAVMSQINTQFSLLGLASADLVMTGGGTGANATAFQFKLENIVMA